MKLVTAYVRAHRASQVMRALHEANVRGLTAYVVHGMSGETPLSFFGLHPFDPANLPESVKIEIFCEDEMAEGIAQIIAQAAKTGYPGDGVIATQDVEKVIKIRDL